MPPTYPTNTHYSENLTRAEVACRCGCKMPAAIDKNLTVYAPAWQKVRVLYGHPMTINCGYRCPAHNATLPGAAKASQHLYGRATDNTPHDHSEAGVIAIAKAALAVPAIRGISIYETEHGCFCHLDTRTGPVWHGVNGITDPARFMRCIKAGHFVP